MTTLSLCFLLTGATLAGAVLGASAALAWRNLHLPDDIARLTAANVGLAHEVEAERARAWRAERKLSVWIGLRNAGSVITVDRRKE
jgi:hypothetical protein